MIIRSKYLIASTGRTIENAEIVLQGKGIAAVRRKSAGAAAASPDTIDLGRAALLPGFVNAKPCPQPL